MFLFFLKKWPQKTMFTSNRPIPGSIRSCLFYNHLLYQLSYCDLLNVLELKTNIYRAVGGLGDVNDIGVDANF